MATKRLDRHESLALMMSSPVEIANQLQQLTLSTYTESHADALAFYKGKHQITNLCMALLRAVQGPEEYTALLAESCQESSALNLVTQLGVADLIADSPNGQLSLHELSVKTKANPQYLGTAISVLNYHGYFIEVGGFSSRIYSNNAFSNVLRSNEWSEMKSMKDAVGLSADDGAKATTRLLDAALAVSTPRTAASIAFDYTGLSLFQWMTTVGNEWRGKRANKAMVQLHAMANCGIGEDYPWETLSTPVIDIGGGIGSFELMLLSIPKNQNLRFIIFDLPKTIEQAQKVWSAKPSEVQEQVHFVAGDFMQSQPEDSKIPTVADGAGTYIIRHVLHDWNDKQVLQILSSVRNAMLTNPSREQKPKLLIVETLLTEHSSRFTHTTSLQLLSLSGGNTRTEVEMRQLIAEAGFVVNAVTEVRGVDLVIEVAPKLD